MSDLKNIIDISMDLNEKTIVWTADAQPERLEPAYLGEGDAQDH